MIAKGSARRSGRSGTLLLELLAASLLLGVGCLIAVPIFVRAERVLQRGVEQARSRVALRNEMERRRTLPEDSLTDISLFESERDSETAELHAPRWELSLQADPDQANYARLVLTLSWQTPEGERRERLIRWVRTSPSLPESGP